jgi:hypothetical protein
MKTINYRGLRPRPTYEEKINYLQNTQDIIKYPNRLAKQIRNSPYLTQLDGVGQSVLEEQQLNRIKEEEKQLEIKKLATTSTQTLKEITSPPKVAKVVSGQKNTPQTQYHDIGTPNSEPTFLSPQYAREAQRDLDLLNKLLEDSDKEDEKRRQDKVRNLNKLFEEAFPKPVYGGSSSSTGPAVATTDNNPLEKVKELDTIKEFLNQGLNIYSLGDLKTMAESRISTGIILKKKLEEYKDTKKDKGSILKSLWNHDKKMLSTALDLQQQTNRYKNITLQPSVIPPPPNRRIISKENSPAKVKN